MASIPDPLTRRELLHLRQKRPVDHAAIASAYQAQARWSETIDFAERITDTAERKRRLEQVRDEVIKLGDAFVLARLNALIPLERSHWDQAAQAARTLGKPRYALRIARIVGDQAEVARLELELGLRAPEPVAPPALAEPEPPTEPVAPA